MAAVIGGADALADVLAVPALRLVCTIACSRVLYPMFTSGVLIASIVVAIRVAARLLHATLGADRAPALARRVTTPMNVELGLVALMLLAGARAISANTGCSACGMAEWHVLVGGPLIDVYSYGALALLWLPVALVLRIRQEPSVGESAGDRPLDRFLAGPPSRPVAASWSTDVRKHPPGGSSG